MNTTNLEMNKLDPEEGDDIPFILCTPTKNEALQAQEDTTADLASSNHMPFFLKPRRSCQCAGCHHQKEGVEPIADMLCDFPLNNNIIMGKDESMDLNSSGWSSPVPTLQTFDVIVTPPVVKLPKRRRHASQEEQREGVSQEEGSSSFKSTGPLFPILGRRADHHLQQQQQIPAIIHCPIPRHHR
jgi:hypothetical protein